MSGAGDDRVDLNLARVFVAVYESRSITAAASRLFVTQPAVSQALGRLRRELDDPLFERNGRFMEPTPLADAIFPRFRDGVIGIDRAVDAVHGFDPTTSDKVFRIALSELGEIGWFPAIAKRFHAQAPQAGIEVVPIDVAALPDQLSRGLIDLAISPSRLPGAFEHTVMKTQGYGVVVSRRHPLAEGELDVGAYAAAEHIVVRGDSGRPALEEAERRAGIATRTRMAVTHFAGLPPLLAASPSLVAAMPDMIGHGWARTWPLVVRDLPFEMAPVQIRLYRRTSAPQTAALDWFATLVSRAVRGSSGEFTAIYADPSEA